MITHGSLFAGIGGFELAARWAGIHTIWSNEIDPFCCNVLRKNFTHEVIQKSIKELSGNELETVDIITGGDPCQPHSIAGKRRGQEDDRFLWPEMFRIIRELHPAFVINENVTGSITNGVLNRKIIVLEGEGYTCQAYVIPAEAVGALHRRDRVWLIAADPDCKRLEKQHVTPLTKEAEGSVWHTGLGFGENLWSVPRHQIISQIIREIDGIPGGLDFTDRYKRIKALGNAVVPQIPYLFFTWIKSIIHEESIKQDISTNDESF